ncbi:MAG: Ig-like domain-containing protein [Gaiellaceae bacterium]
MRTRDSHRRGLGAGGAILAVAVAILVGAMTAGTASAATPQALILGSSVSGGASSLEGQRATADGFNVTVVTDAQWLVMTASDFAQYQLIIVGDPTCSVESPVVSQNATALATAVMGHASGGPTQAGNRILIGTDPVYHTNFTKPEAGNLIKAGIDFAGAQLSRTNLYLDSTCADPDYNGNGTPDLIETLLPQLSIAANTWSENTSPPCGGSVSLISNADQFSILHSSDLQGWFCSVHESFPTYPSDWTPLAIATDTSPPNPTCGNDVDTGAAACGQAYILIAGSGIVATSPNLSLSPTMATNPVGTPHTVTATVTNPDTTPAAGVLVTFTVTGANAGASGTCSPADCKTNASGQVTFTYTGTSAGDDTINASINISGTVQTATAAKTWTVGGDTTPPTCVLSSKNPAQIQVTLQDTGSGLDTVTPTTSNATATVGSFSSGTTSPVVVTANKTDLTKSASLAITATDVDGNTVKCDPVWGTH